MTDEGGHLAVSLEELDGFGQDDQRLARLDAAVNSQQALDELIDEVRVAIHGELDRAVRAAAWSPGLVDRLGSLAQRISIRTHCATALAYANRFDDALRMLANAHALAENACDPSLRASVSMSMVQPLARLGRISEASHAAQCAIELYDEGADEQLVARARINLGALLRMQRNSEAAIQQYDQALPVVMHDAMLHAQLESNRAIALLDLCRFEQAEAALRAAIKAFETIDAIRGAALAEGNLADLLGRQGRSQAALYHFERAQRVYERSDAPGDAARLLAERAEVLASVGSLTEALSLFDDAITRLSATELVHESFRASYARALVLIRLGQNADAASSLSALCADLVPRGMLIELARAQTALARTIAMDRSRYDESRRLLDGALAYLNDRPDDRAETLLAIATVELHASQPHTALAWSERALEAARALQHFPRLASALHLRGRALRMLGRSDEALESLMEAVKVIERTRGTLFADRLRSAWLGDRIGVYADVCAAAMDKKTPDAHRLVFDTIERAKCRSLLDMVAGGVELAEQITQESGSPEERLLVEKLAAHRAELNAMFAAIHDPDERAQPANRAVMLDRVPALERAISGIEGRLASTRRFGEILGTPIDLDEAQQLLGPHDAIVEYTTLGGELGALVLRRDRVEMYRSLCSIEQMRAICSKITFQIERAIASAASVPQPKARSRMREALGLGYDTFVRPMQTILADCDRVRVIPTGELFGIAWHALHDGERHLIERASVTYAPSSSLLSVMKRRVPVPGAKDKLVIGVSDSHAPRIEAEAHAVAKALGDCTSLIGQAATAGRFAELAPSASLIHIASHGLFPEHAPLDAAIRLADRWVSAREVFGISLAGAHVVLSSCQVGRSSVLAGDEIFGLVRAFLAAGATSLVTSLWAAHDEQTLELMTSLYESVGSAPEGWSLAQALTRAQRHMIRQGVHPAHWASFVCIGD